MINWKLVFYLVVTVLGAPSTGIIRAQTTPDSAEPQGRHLIISLDASGSVLESRPQRAALEGLLSEIPSLAFQGGFSPDIAPLSEHDAVSLVHLGAYVGDTDYAYRGLRELDLRRDFAHPAFLWERGLDQTGLATRLRASTTVYRLSLRFLAEPMTLLAARAPAGETAARTFALFITDGVANEDASEGEVGLVRQWGNPASAPGVLAASAAVYNDYRFSEGSSGTGPIWSRTVEDEAGEPLLFAELIEVTPRAETDWRASAPERAVRRTRTRWAPTDSVTLAVALTDPYLAWAGRLALNGSVALAIGQQETVQPAATDLADFEVRAPAPSDVCSPPTILADLTTSWVRADSLLGRRVARHRSPVELLVEPALQCTAVGYAKMLWPIAAAILLLGMALLLVFVRQRLLGVYIRVPTFRHTPALNSADPPALRVPLAPHLGTIAFEVILPGPQQDQPSADARLQGWARLKEAVQTNRRDGPKSSGTRQRRWPKWARGLWRAIQWLALQGVTLTIKGGDGALVWSGSAETHALRLPPPRGRGGRRAAAVWRALPESPIEIQIFRGSSLLLTARFPNPRMNESTTAAHASEVRYPIEIALDLGSESMAAYYYTALQNVNSPGPIEPVDLKANASLLLDNPTHEGGENAPILVPGDDKGNKRIRTRIRLRDRLDAASGPHPAVKDLQEGRLTDDHAKLNLLRLEGREVVRDEDEFDKGLFGFFDGQHGSRPGDRIPNPKIPFQAGATDVIPTTDESMASQGIKPRPDDLIIHVVAQVVNNVLLLSPEIRAARASGNPKVRLTITVPVVYSLTHAETLKERVSALTGVVVDTVYEPFAVAYAAQSPVSDVTDSPELIEFKQLLQRALREEDGVQLLTVDIGRGTTDMSWVRIEAPGGPRSVATTGMVGKSTGGNAATHIFATYYQRALTAQLAEAGWEEVREEILLRGPVSTKEDLLDALNELIERMKAGMGEDYTVGVPEKHQQGLLANFLKPQGPKGEERSKLSSFIRPNPKYEGERLDAPALQDALVNALVLPPDALTYTSKFPKVLRRSEPGRDALKRELRKSLEAYVSENAEDLIYGLHEQMDAREIALRKRRGLPLSDPGAKKLKRFPDTFSDHPGFAVIAGQGSQFRPLRKALLEVIADQFGIEGSQTLLLNGPAAKEACAFGALYYRKQGDRVQNPTEIIGAYCYLDNATGETKSVNLLNISSHQEEKTLFKDPVLRTLVYSSLPFDDEFVPIPGDGNSAFICDFAGANVYRTSFNGSKLLVKMAVGDGSESDVTMGSIDVELATFGLATPTIYPSVWPERLPDDT